jgi:hypothetical protein
MTTRFIETIICLLAASLLFVTALQLTSYLSGLGP